MRGQIFDASVRAVLLVGAVEILQRKRDVVGETLQEPGQFSRERTELARQEYQRADGFAAAQQRQGGTRSGAGILDDIIEVSGDAEISEIIVADARFL